MTALAAVQNTTSWCCTSEQNPLHRLRPWRQVRCSRFSKPQPPAGCLPGASAPPSRRARLKEGFGCLLGRRGVDSLCASIRPRVSSTLTRVWDVAMPTLVKHFQPTLQSWGRRMLCNKLLDPGHEMAWELWSSWNCCVGLGSSLEITFAGCTRAPSVTHCRAYSILLGWEREASPECVIVTSL